MRAGLDPFGYAMTLLDEIMLFWLRPWRSGSCNKDVVLGCIIQRI